MTLSEPNTYKQVLGSLMKQPSLYSTVNNKIEMADFDLKIMRLLFENIVMFIQNGAESITVEDIDLLLLSSEIYKKIYEQANGLSILQDAIAISNPDNFNIYYDRLKKLSLLRALKKNGYDISFFFKENFDNIQEEKEYIKRFEEANCTTICEKIESGFCNIRERFLAGEGNGKQAGEKIVEMIDEFKKTPEIGANMLGEYMNTVTRGARLGKYYLRSAGTNVGKSRLAFADMCYIAIPEYYHLGKEKFVIEDRAPGCTLIITTEMEAEEVQTILLAYISGVNEEHIIYGRYDEGEEDRVRKAAEILKKYSSTFFIEEISDPNLSNVQAVIKKHALVNKIQYCCYDYLFTSPSLIGQFQQSGIREDVALTMLSTQLKEIAKQYNIFMMSATQVNAEGSKWDGPKDQNAIRGAKGIADKCDVGMVISPVGEEEIKLLARAYAQNFVLKGKGNPTHVIDVYKVRRGRYKNVRIWCRFDLGTGRREDLFVTNRNYEVIENMKVIDSIKFVGEEEEKVEETKERPKSALLDRLDQIHKEKEESEQKMKENLDNIQAAGIQTYNNMLKPILEVAEKITKEEKKKESLQWDEFL